MLVWDGPYLARLPATRFRAIRCRTGYTAYVKNYIVRYDADHNAAHDYVVGTGTGGVFSPTATIYAAVTITGLSVSQAQAINTLIDGPNDPSIASGLFTGANVMQATFDLIGRTLRIMS